MNESIGLLGTNRNGRAPALVDLEAGAIDRSLDHGAMDDRIARLAGQLRAVGAAEVDAIVWAMPNGVKTALLYLSALQVGAAAPLNPKLTRRELSSRMSALGTTILITDERANPEAAELADPDRIFTLAGSALAPDLIAPDGSSITPADGSGDDADGRSAEGSLVLLTSGTTGDPKRVRLTTDQLVSAADAIASTLRLDGRDIGLSIMPQFHIHGLQAALLAPLRAGGCVAIPPTFDAFSVARQVEATSATWFSAVPSMHQLVLSRSGATADRWARTLRFIRTSSSALAPSLHAELESTYGIPVVEAYGMTECAHQIASNRLDDRRPGSVGFATGVELRIVEADATGVGQVEVRGPSVIERYDDPAAPQFADGWFATGDEGRLDDGCLTLTGRSREMINRAGEKVRPLEVEQVLEAMPAVAQAAVFAVPDELLGERVAAAVVAIDGEAPPSAKALAAHARTQLAKFKVPAEFIVVDAIPTGPTGKVQRRRLAEQLDLTP